MKWDEPFIEGRLIQRYKRFLADVTLADGRSVTAHTPNTGAMLGCSDPGSRVWLRDTQNPTRKYPYSWEIVENNDGILIGIHTGHANALVVEAIQNGTIESLAGYTKLQREKTFSEAHSRFDIFLSQHPSQPDCYVEVKNVTAVDDAKNAFFPDAVSVRGTKHLHGLVKVKQAGLRAVLCFCIQRNDALAVRAATEIDPIYSAALSQAAAQGVEILAYRADVNPPEIFLKNSLPIIL